MNLMQRQLPMLLFAASLALPASGQEGDEILARHTEARGGAAAIEAIESVEVYLTIDEGWVVDGHYRATRAGDMRIDVFAEGERVFTEALHDGVQLTVLRPLVVNSIDDGSVFVMPTE